MQLGDLMFRVGNLEGSEQAYQKASSMYRQRGEHDYEKDAYISLGRVLQKRGSLGKAEEVFRKALVDIKHAGGSPIIEARALNAIGLLQIRQGDYEGALKSLTRATQIFSAAGDKAASALAQFNIGYLESSRGNDDRAMHIFQAFVKNGEPLRQDRLAVAYGNLGIIYYTKGWLEQAKEMYQKQLEIEKKLDRKEGIVASLQSLGNLASTQKSFIEAESLLKNALRIAEQHYLAYRVATTNIILGDVYQQTGKFAAAEACALRALSVAKQNNLDSILGNTYDNLGRLSERRGDLARARRYHSKALLVFEGQDNKPGVRLQKAVLRRLAAHRAQPH